MLVEVVLVVSNRDRVGAAQVGEVEAVFVALKADVEALFMTAPSVNLAELAHEVADAHRHADSQVGAAAPCSGQLLAVSPRLEPPGEGGASLHGALPECQLQGARGQTLLAGWLWPGMPAERSTGPAVRQRPIPYHIPYPTSS
jgi:hypothetical protein